MSAPVSQDKDFQGCQAKSLRAHNITSEGDIPSEGQVDGGLYYFTSAGQKALAYWDAERSRAQRVHRSSPGLRMFLYQTAR